MVQSAGLENDAAQGVVAAYTGMARTDDRQSAAKLETAVKRAVEQKAEIDADLNVAKMELEASLEAPYAALQSATAETVEAAQARYDKAVKIAQAKLDAARIKAKNKAATIDDSIVEIAENLHQNTVQKQQKSATMQTTDRVGRNEGAGEIKIPEPPKLASLSDVDARKWYLDSESKIPSLLDKTKSLEQQAKQAVELRNQFRTQARAAMTNRTAAEALDITDPNQTWEMLVDKYSAKGLSGDDLFREIINAAQRSRTGVNHMLGID